MSKVPLFFRKQGGALVPMSEQARESLSRLPVDRDVVVEVKQPRNIAHHRKFWALAQLVFENQEYFPTVEAVVAALKSATGHCDMIAGKDGTMIAVPRSISFGSMDQVEFNRFYDSCVTVVVEKIIPGIQDGALRREVEDLVA